MKSKQAEMKTKVKGDGANNTNVLDSGAGAGAGMALAGHSGQWPRRARCAAALAALLAAVVLLAVARAHYLQVRRLERLLYLEKHSDELLRNLEVLDHHMSMNLDRLAALHRP